MRVQSRDRIVELECGEGDVSVALAARVPQGMVVAMDSSADRIRTARIRARDLDNVMFLPSAVGQIPWKEAFFSKALSHGFPRDPQDLLRVLVPEGLVYLAVEPRPHSDNASPESSGVEEWAERLKGAGFSMVEVHQLPGNCTVLVGKKPA